MLDGGEPCPGMSFTLRNFDVLVKCVTEDSNLLTFIFLIIKIKLIEHRRYACDEKV